MNESLRGKSVAEVTCDMAGIVSEILVKPGDRVDPDQDLIVLESMKMQIPVKAPRAGTISDIRVAPGDFVNQGDVLLELE